MRRQTIFIGESPPAGAPANFSPFDCASGTMLSKHLGLVDRAALLDRTHRVNVFDAPMGVESAPSWNTAEATHRAARIASGIFPDDHRYHRYIDPHATLILLGRRVAEAFGLNFNPLHYIPTKRDYPSSTHHHVRTVIVAPHPSPRSTKIAGTAIREFRRGLLLDVIAGSPLQVLDFRLGDLEVLADLAHAICPRAPQIAAATLRLIVVASRRFPGGFGETVKTVLELKAHALFFAFATEPAERVLEACFVSLSGLVTRAEWGFGRKSDKGPYGDDLARAVRLDPTFARACAMRAEILGRT